MIQNKTTDALSSSMSSTMINSMTTPVKTIDTNTPPTSPSPSSTTATTTPSSSSSSSSTTTSTTSPSASPRRVRFATNEKGAVLAVAAVSPVCCANDVASMWWDDDEFGGIRSDAQRMALSVSDKIDPIIWSKPQNKAYRKAITRIYRACLKEAVSSSSSTSSSSISGGTMKHLDWNLQEDLEFWCCVGHSVRGLEKYIIGELFKGRDQRKRQIYRSIRYITKRGIRENMPQHEIDELIRLASEVTSEPARYYARTFAAADQVAAFLEHRNTIKKASTSSTDLPDGYQETVERVMAGMSRRTPARRKSDKRRSSKRSKSPKRNKAGSTLRRSLSPMRAAAGSKSPRGIASLVESAHQKDRKVLSIEAAAAAAAALADDDEQDETAQQRHVSPPRIPTTGSTASPSVPQRRRKTSRKTRNKTPPRRSSTRSRDSTNSGTSSKEGPERRRRERLGVGSAAA